MIVLIPRTYSLWRSRFAGALGLIAVAVLVAGCGAGGSAPPSTTGSAAAAPAAPAFDAQLADQRSQSAAANAGGLASQQASQQATPAAPSASHPTTSKPVVKPASKPAPVIHATPVIRIRTVTKPGKTRTVVRVVTKTVTKTVAPNLPDGAFMPSAHPALAQPTFTVAGDNIACAFTHGRVRCDIQQRIWAPPAQPSNCAGTWGNAVNLGSAGLAAFICAGKGVASANAEVVPDGWDDKVGKITCQVRRFGVDCFSTSRHGFIVSRTGYTLY